MSDNEVPWLWSVASTMLKDGDAVCTLRVDRSQWSASALIKTGTRWHSIGATGNGLDAQSARDSMTEAEAVGRALNRVLLDLYGPKEEIKGALSVPETEKRGLLSIFVRPSRDVK